ncbi:hypothetical protein [Deinococcus cellulosilyticus]|uniref:DUF3618 domain-containing protein n=1 Tax=Deinococcus cellulosilyticus (strain DSM 18568 / NBRC 106333 / KACC 11606 / 5516J-15) TaxID=1223518 RepID=A0A511N6M4_DEIC1|nr:hypothetical protein [Deinococcus cellulosilyticus]GEM48086.1 hypothetical protein DC3_37210 [Deinococcus cellulosilyticus NBRC 106333 = KACC 11606]
MTAHNKDNFSEKISERVTQVAETVREKVEEISEKARKEFHEPDFDNIREPVIRVVEDAKVKADQVASDVKEFAAKAQDSTVWKNLQEDRSRNLILLAVVLGIFALLFMRRRS